MSKSKKKFRKSVLGYHEKWKRLLALSWWRSKVVFFNYLTNPDGSTFVASCDVNWQYQDYTLNINEIDLRRRSNSTIERVVVHELLHAVVNEMREQGIKHEERVTTHLECAILFMLNKGR